MKLFSAAISLLLTSCAAGPSATAFAPDGTKIHLRTGGTVMAERDLVVAEVSGPGGWSLKYSAAKEDSTKVPNTYIGYLLGKYLAGTQAGVTKAETAANRDIALGAQGVQKHAAEQETIKATFVKP